MICLLYYSIFFSSFIFPRIQQIQLLGRNLKGDEHNMLWSQIESEIHLHRHKTVIRACRGRQAGAASNNKKVPSPPKPEITENDNVASVGRKKRGIGEPRLVKLHRDKNEGLGISITVIFVTIIQSVISVVSTKDAIIFPFLKLAPRLHPQKRI